MATEAMGVTPMNHPRMLDNRILRKIALAAASVVIPVVGIVGFRGTLGADDPSISPVKKGLTAAARGDMTGFNSNVVNSRRDVPGRTGDLLNYTNINRVQAGCANVSSSIRVEKHPTISDRTVDVVTWDKSCLLDINTGQHYNTEWVTFVNGKDGGMYSIYLDPQYISREKP